MWRENGIELKQVQEVEHTFADQPYKKQNHRDQNRFQDNVAPFTAIVFIVRHLSILINSVRPYNGCWHVEKMIVAGIREAERAIDDTTARRIPFG